MNFQMQYKSKINLIPYKINKGHLLEKIIILKTFKVRNLKKLIFPSEMKCTMYMELVFFLPNPYGHQWEKYEQKSS